MILGADDSPTFIPNSEKSLPFLTGSIMAAFSLVLGSLLVRSTILSMSPSFFFLLLKPCNVLAPRKDIVGQRWDTLVVHFGIEDVTSPNGLDHV